MIVLAGGTVIVDAATEYEAGYVAFENGTVTAVGPGAPTPELISAADTVEDCTGRAVMPGFISAHAHLFQSMLRGISTDRSLESWLIHDIWPNVERFKPEDFRLAALSGLLENLRSGVTTVLENHYVHTSARNVDEVCAALEESGVRGLVARGGVDRVGHADSHPAPRYIEDRWTYLRETEKFLDRWDGAGDGRIRGECALQTTWLASPELCREVAAFAADRGVGIHAHCAETRTSVRATEDSYGMREVQFFAAAGVLRPGTQLVHCVWLDDSERSLLAESGATVVSCPTSNAYLGSGIPPVPDLRGRGITVALGSDGPASNNGQNMFETLKWTALMQRAISGEPAVLGEWDVLDMAWNGGAEVVGLPGRLGRLTVGAAADLVVLDVSKPPYHGTAGIRQAVVFSGSPGDVLDVWVAGKRVLRDGMPTQFDAAALDRDIHDRMSALGIRAM